VLNVVSDESADEQDHWQSQEECCAKDCELDDESLDLFPGCFEGVSDAEKEINVHADSQNDDDPAWNASELVELITLVVSELAETHDHHVDNSEQHLIWKE